MQILRARVRHFLTAWPVLAVVPLFAAHMLIHTLFPRHGIIINRLVSTATQMAGGLFVLHSLNRNLGLFRDQSLVSLVAAWFRGFRLIGRSVTGSLTGVLADATAGGMGTLSYRRAGTTMEERLSEVERQLEEFRAATHQREAALSRRIEKAQADLSQSIAANQSSIANLANQVEKVIVGSFKWQVFGVMLLFYGTLTRLFV